MITTRLKITARQGGIYCDVYDYTVNRAIEQKKCLTIKVGNESMVLTPTELKTKPHHLTDEVFISKFGGQNYKLISFRWVPVKPLTQEEIYLKYLT